MSYIKDCGVRETDLNLSKILSGFKQKKFTACFTDCFFGGYVSESGELCSPYNGESYDFNKLLEVRVFDDKSELWIHRSSIGEPFSYRVAEDEENIASSSYFDEVQLLDIDGTFKSNATLIECVKEFKATGGGKYTLPINNDANAVEIRNYLKYSEATSRAEIIDFRIKRFIKEG